jgi:hypothetical protein
MDNIQIRFTPVQVKINNVYQLLSHGQWFSPSTPASSTTKTGRHDIAEILLKVALNAIAPTLTPNPLKMKSSLFFIHCCYSQFLVNKYTNDRGEYFSYIVAVSFIG